MRPGKAARAAALLLVLAFTAGMFVVIIWNPLYGRREVRDYAEAQEQAPLEAEIVREDGGVSKSWSVTDREALAKLRKGLAKADNVPAPAPRADQKFRLRIRRSDSRVDEYEVQLDDRGREHDMLYVVRREGGGSVYGSAFRTPELRDAIQRVLTDPKSAPK